MIVLPLMTISPIVLTQLTIHTDQLQKRNSQKRFSYISSIPRNKRNKINQNNILVATCFLNINFLTFSGVFVANQVSVHPVVLVFGFLDQSPPNILTSGCNQQRPPDAFNTYIQVSRMIQQQYANMLHLYN